MKKNIIISTVIILVTTSMLFSCNKELQSVNQNPNNLEKADPTTLLSNVIVSEFYNNAFFAWTAGNGYNQYMTFSQDYYNTTTRYTPVSNSPYWTTLFEDARDANTLYTTAQTNGNPFLQAVALTLRSYAFAQLTELWKDIPFTQSLQGATGNYTPQYDDQQTVYTDPQLGIIPSLRRADSLLKANSTAIISGDMLYGGKTDGWRRFINALRLRYLLRVSSKMDVGAEMQSIVNDGTIMQSAAQSGTLALPTVIPYNFPSLTERSGDFNVKFMNSTLYNAFVNTADTARIQLLFNKNANSASQTSFDFSYYGGMPIVVDATADQTNQSSKFNSNFVSGLNKPLISARIITYAEQEFILAEAAMKGYISGNAQDYYNAGVMGAYAEYGIDATTASNYLSHSAVAYDNESATHALEQIITQKWIANINNGFEGWIEYRRTGYPQLSTGGDANLNGGAIPSRFLYPDDEKTINQSNYSSEVQKMGGTEITTYKAWWEQ